MIRMDNIHYEIDDLYDLERLKQYDKFCSADKKRCLEAIEQINAFQERLYKQAQKVTEANFYKHVTIARVKGTDDLIRYFVDLNQFPEGVEKARPVRLEHHRFSGKERGKAIRFAEALAEKYRCSIKKQGFKKRG